MCLSSQIYWWSVFTHCLEAVFQKITILRIIMSSFLRVAFIRLEMVDIILRYKQSSSWDMLYVIYRSMWECCIRHGCVLTFLRTVSLVAVSSLCSLKWGIILKSSFCLWTLIRSSAEGAVMLQTWPLHLPWQRLDPDAQRALPPVSSAANLTIIPLL